MILSDKTILEYGEKLVSPFNPNNVQPNSYDITLGNEFLEPDRTTVVIGEKAPCYEKIEKEFYIIPPFGFILATTEEYVKIPTDITGFVYAEVRLVAVVCSYIMQDYSMQVLRVL